MRLNSEQILIIIETVQTMMGKFVSIRIFGSRLNDRAKGGDVDLLIETPQLLNLLQKAQLKNLLENRLNLPVDLLIVKTGQNLTPFQQIAFENSVLL